MRTGKRAHKRQGGQVAVETAMLLPVVLLLLLGLLDFGRFLWTRSVALDAAAEGARLAAMAEPQDSEIVTRVLQELERGGVHSTPSVVVGVREAAQPVSVNVTLPFDLLVLPGLLDSTSGSWVISVSCLTTHER